MRLEGVPPDGKMGLGGAGLLRERWESEPDYGGLCSFVLLLMLLESRPCVVCILYLMLRWNELYSTWKTVGIG